MTTVPGIGASRLPLATCVGGVDEARRVAQRSVATGPSTSTSGAPAEVATTTSKGGPHPVDLEHTRSGRPRRPPPRPRARTRRGRPTTATATAPSKHGDLRLGRRRCATRPGCPAGRYALSRSRSARASAAADRARVPSGSASPRRLDLRMPRASPCSPPRPGTPRRAGSATSWSRLVVSPWIRARASTPAQLRGPPARGSAPAGDHLGQHRVVVRRHLAAGLRSRSRRGCPSARVGMSKVVSGRSAAGSRRPGPRRRAAPRSACPVGAVVEAGAARSKPGPRRRRSAAPPGRRRATASVTGCSTWRRVFISRKKNRSVSRRRRGTRPCRRRGSRSPRRPLRRGLVQCGADLLAQAGRGRLLDDLLVAALDRAVPLAEDQHSVGVADDLHLDVAAVLDVRLDEDGAVAERRRRLGLGGGDLAGQLREGAHDPHPPAAATGGGLHQQRQVGLGAVSTVRLRRAPGRRPPPSASWRAILEPIASIDSGRGADPGRARRRSPRGRSRRSRRGTRSRDGSRRRRSPRAASRTSVDAQVGLGRGVARAAVRRGRPRRRTAARRRRRSAPPRSRCRASRQVRKTRLAISPRLATSSSGDHRGSVRCEVACVSSRELSPRGARPGSDR